MLPLHEHVNNICKAMISIQVTLTVKDPTRNAATSVSVVTVIETPACCNVRPIFSGKDISLFPRFKFFQQATITNMSSTPIPSSKNGSAVCTGPYEIPSKEQNPHATANAIIMQNKPLLPRMS
jgi:hypothetical protein